MDDCIRRQQAIDALKSRKTAEQSSAGVMRNAVVDFCIGIIKKLPSAQPKPEIGHWVEIGDEPYDEWECDVCGFTIDGSGCIDPEEYRDIYRFCPNCGADMRGEQDG